MSYLQMINANCKSMRNMLEFKCNRVRKTTYTGVIVMSVYIAICDDERGVCGTMETALIDILTRLNIKYEIDVYSSGEKLCNEMDAGASYDLIFLDIELTGDTQSGIDVGKRIRGAMDNNAVSIVFMSWEAKYSLQLFDISPLNFLIKPLDANKIENVVRRYLKVANIWSGNFSYKIGHRACYAAIKDIIYMESSGRKIIIHMTDNRKEIFYGGLKEIYREQLKKHDFLLIHNAYAVNYLFVQSFKYEELTLKELDLVLPISQTRRKDVRETFYAIRERLE